MLWGAHLPDRVAAADVLVPLLERALAAAPANPALHVKLGYAFVDAKDYAAAAASFDAALRLDPALLNLRPILARCYNHLHRHQEALQLLADDEAPSYERARALLETGALDEAEAEFRALLAAQPDHPEACRLLSRLLRRQGRNVELLALCEGLAARGAANAQLLYNWGWALALAGDAERARRLMFDPERVAAFRLAPPEGFADIAAFNAALAQDILANPNMISSFPEEEANRGSRRVDNLFTGRRPDLVRLLLAAIQAKVEQWHPAPRDGFDPWPRARPAAARLRPWGLVQYRAEYEEGHIHPTGWLSGVYYVRVPAAVAAGDDGRGCIEFGPPTAIEKAMPGFAPVRRYVPEEGLLLLSPSHYQHRTIPTNLGEARISIAFDLVPDPPAA